MYTTIFYSKATGKIATYATTEVPQNMDFFGDGKVDFEQIYDFLVIEHSEQVQMIIRNKDMFLVDLETKKIIQKNVLLDIL